MPLLTGISVVCLAKQDRLVLTNIFGSSNGNERLGIFSLGLNWQFPSSKPLWTPLAKTEAISHLLLWDWDDIESGYAFLSPRSLHAGLFPAIVEPQALAAAAPGRPRSPQGKGSPLPTDVRVPSVPSWWDIYILVLSVVMGLMATYAAESTLPWYGFLTSIILAGTFIPFFGAQVALTGFQGNCAGRPLKTRRLMIDGCWFNAFANLEHALEGFRANHDKETRFGNVI